MSLRKLMPSVLAACLGMALSRQALASSQAGSHQEPARRIAVLPSFGSPASRIQLPGGPKASVGDIMLLQFEALLGLDPQAALQGLRVTARTLSGSDERAAARRLLQMIAAPETVPAALSAAIREGLGRENISILEAGAASVQRLAAANPALAASLETIRRDLANLDLDGLEPSAEVLNSFYTASNPRKPGIHVPKIAAQPPEPRKPSADLSPRPGPAAHVITRGSAASKGRWGTASPQARGRVLPQDFLGALARYKDLRSTLAWVEASRAGRYQDAFDSRRAGIYRVPVTDDLSAHASTLSDEMRALDARYPQLRHWGTMKLLGVAGLLAAFAGFGGALFMLLAANIPVALALGLISFTGTVTAYRVAADVAKAQTPNAAELKALGIPDNPVRPLLAAWALTGGVITLGSAVGLALAGKPIWAAVAALKGAAEFWLAWRLGAPRTPSVAA